MARMRAVFACCSFGLLELARVGFTLDILVRHARGGNTPAMDSSIEAFLAGKTFAVAGASSDRAKFGNKVLRCYQQAGRKVYAIHPRETLIEGELGVPKLADL